MPDGMVDYIDLYQKLLEKDIEVFLFVGNMDAKDGPYGVQEWMKKLKWEYMGKYRLFSGFIL